MAQRVFRRIKAERTVFKRLAFGRPYWLSTNVATAPSIKLDRNDLLNGYNQTTGAPTASAVSPTNVAVIRVPQPFMGQVIPP